MRTTQTLTATLLLVTFSALANAHEEEENGGHSKAIDYRNSVMNILKWNISYMGKMVKGEIPYDHAAFARHAKDLNVAAHLDLMSGFPEDSDEGEDTAARSDIWMDWEGFVEKYVTLKKASSELAEISSSGGLEAIKPRFGSLGKACKSCHDTFKD